jgi:hypothetical protein
MIPARFLVFVILSLATNFLAHARPGIAGQRANGSADSNEDPKPADQGQELLVPRLSLSAEVSQGYKHIREIAGPIRKVAAGQIGNAYLWESNAYITVIGTLSDVGVQTVLRLIGERVLDATKVTGDEMYAVVQLGDPERDACCTTTILFGNQTGSWEQLADIWQSH